MMTTSSSTPHDGAGTAVLDRELRRAVPHFQTIATVAEADAADVRRRSRQQTRTRTMAGGAVAAMLLCVGVGAASYASGSRSSELDLAATATETSPPSADQTPIMTSVPAIGVMPSTTIAPPTSAAAPPVTSPDTSPATTAPANSGVPSTTASPPSTTAATTVPVQRPAVLRSDGLGFVSIGDEADVAYDAMRERFGAPSWEMGWQADGWSGNGVEYRSARWGALEASFERLAGQAGTFVQWAYLPFNDDGNTPALATRHGLRPPASIADIKRFTGNQPLERFGSENGGDHWGFRDGAGYLCGNVVDAVGAMMYSMLEDPQPPDDATMTTFRAGSTIDGNCTEPSTFPGAEGADVSG